MFSPRLTLLRQVYSILKPFGRRRLAYIIAFNLVQGFLQAVSVFAVMTFLLVVTEQTGENGMAQEILERVMALGLFPETDIRIVWGLIAILVIVVANLWNLAGEFVRTYYTAKTGFMLTTGILRTWADRPYAYFLKNNSSLLMKKAQGDVVTFMNGVLGPMLDVNARILMALFICGSLFVANPMVTLLLSGTFIAFYFVFYLLARRLWKVVNHQFNFLAKTAIKSMFQFLTGVKPIFVHEVRSFFLASYEAAARKNVRYRSIAPLVSNGPRYIVEIVLFGGGVVTVTIMVMRGVSILEMAPTLTTFLYGGYRLLPNVQLIFGTIGSIKSNRYTVDEILGDIQPQDLHRVHSPLPPRIEKQIPFRDSIRVEGVQFQYASGGEAVLHDLSLTIRKGEKVAFVGHTGSGKSTLVDMLLGLHVPTAGRICIDETPLTLERVGPWRRRIGYVPQDIFLVDDTVRRNIAFGLDEDAIDDERVSEAIRMAQAEEFVFNKLSEGVETEVGERGVRLSGGQRQRLGLARALYHQPDVLVLDEATSALDNATEAAIMEVIEGLSQNLTVIMIAHRLSTVRRADRIYLLDQGRLVAEGTYDELLASSESFQALASSGPVG